MGFSKAFPRYVGKSTYPVWEEITLTKEDEEKVEEQARIENIKVMEESIKDSQQILKALKLKDFQSDVIRLSVALFEKRSGHLAFHKESKCKEIFDEKFR